MFLLTTSCTRSSEEDALLGLCHCSSRPATGESLHFPLCLLLLISPPFSSLTSPFLFFPKSNLHHQSCMLSALTPANKAALVNLPQLVLHKCCAQECLAEFDKIIWQNPIYILNQLQKAVLWTVLIILAGFLLLSISLTLNSCSLSLSLEIFDVPLAVQF